MEAERRTVLQLGGLFAVGGLVAACGSSTSVTSTSGAAVSNSAQAPASSGGTSSGGGTVLTPTASVPIGGGVVLQDLAVVVTQPTSGDFKAFSAICTHQGCLVGPVENNEIVCPCHGSRFSATDGAVLQGPATQALAASKVSVVGGDVVLGA
jgi:Rieske Fe-S protein